MGGDFSGPRVGGGGRQATKQPCIEGERQASRAQPGRKLRRHRRGAHAGPRDNRVIIACQLGQPGNACARKAAVARLGHGDDPGFGHGHA